MEGCDGAVSIRGKPLRDACGAGRLRGLALPRSRRAAPQPEPKGLHDVPLVQTSRRSRVHPSAHLSAAPGLDCPGRAPDSPLPGLDRRHGPPARLGAGGGLRRGRRARQPAKDQDPGLSGGGLAERRPAGAALPARGVGPVAAKPGGDQWAGVSRWGTALAATPCAAQPR